MLHRFFLTYSFHVENSTWLWNIARGVSGEEVQGRILPKSHGSGKTFPGPRALRSIDTVCLFLPCGRSIICYCFYYKQLENLPSLTQTLGFYCH